MKTRSYTHKKRRVRHPRKRLTKHKININKTRRIRKRQTAKKITRRNNKRKNGGGLGNWLKNIFKRNNGSVAPIVVESVLPSGVVLSSVGTFTTGRSPARVNPLPPIVTRELSNRPKIHRVIYIENDTSTHFDVMIKKIDFFGNVLFIFNDNIFDHKTNNAGSGNAIIRPYNIYGKTKKDPNYIARAAGISIGPGFFSLDTVIRIQTNRSLVLNVKDYIDKDIEEIQRLLNSHNYTDIYFIGDSSNPDMIGTNIFAVGNDVKKYIQAQIYTLGISCSNSTDNLHFNGDGKEASSSAAASSSAKASSSANFAPEILTPIELKKKTVIAVKPKPTIHPVLYIEDDKSTHFDVMIKNLELYGNALFIYNDNFEQHNGLVVGNVVDDVVRDDTKRCKEGKGNSKIRPYNQLCPQGSSKPRAAGISTRLYESYYKNDAFTSFDKKIPNTYPITVNTVKENIKKEISDIQTLLNEYNYTDIYFTYHNGYSSKNKDFIKIFNVNNFNNYGLDVLEYIYDEILKLGNMCHCTENFHMSSNPTAGPSTAGPSTAGPSSSRSGPSSSRSGPSSSRAGPSLSRAGPSSSRAGPSSIIAGPSSSRAGPSSSTARASSITAGPSSSTARASSSTARASSSTAGQNIDQNLNFQVSQSDNVFTTLNFFTSSNAVVAINTLLYLQLINQNTLVVFDLDGTLVKSNANDENRETPLDDFTFVDLNTMFKNLSAVGTVAKTAIVSGRDNKFLDNHKKVELKNIGITIDDIHFVGTYGNKGDKIAKIIEMHKQNDIRITRVIYLDDFMQSVIDTYFGFFEYTKNSTLANTEFAGIKVGNSEEKLFDDFLPYKTKFHPLAYKEIMPQRPQHQFTTIL